MVNSVENERLAFEAWADSAGHPFDSTDDAFVVWQARAALAVAPVQAQEPVAYRWPDGPGKFYYQDVSDPVADFAQKTAELLYLAPVQPVAVPDGYEVSDNSETWNAIAAKVREEMAAGMAILAAPAAQGDAKVTTKQVCTNCAGEGRFYKTVMTSFGSGECEETVCKVCVGRGVVYSAIAAKAAS